MNDWKNVWLEILFTGLIVIILLLIFCVSESGRARGGVGGTDTNIEINSESDGSDYQWNQIHGIKIMENGNRIIDPFNITVCEFILEVNGNLKPGGHIFGELNGISWNDIPQPTITISVNEFKEYADGNNHTLMLYILGSYQRETSKGSELRQAYLSIEIIRPNQAPIAIAQITDSTAEGKGNWTEWKSTDNKSHLNEYNEFEYCTDSFNDSFQLFFNASSSWDGDNDTIMRWCWDLDNDGFFGDSETEKKMNTSVDLDVGEHVIGLMVFDGQKWSDTLLIPILILPCRDTPDLIVLDLYLENSNGQEIYQTGDEVNIIASIGNIGNSQTLHHFKIVLSYRYGLTDAEFVPMSIKIIENPIEVDEVFVVEYNWNTISMEFKPEMYAFKVVIESAEYFSELREKNNHFTIENISLTYGLPQTPHLEIYKVQLSSIYIPINDVVHIDVTINNIGITTAHDVSLQYYIDDIYCYTYPIDTLEECEMIDISFAFTGDKIRENIIHFIIEDNGVIVGRSDDFSIFSGYRLIDPPPPPDPPPPKLPDEDDTYSIEIRSIQNLFTIAFLVSFFIIILIRYSKSERSLDTFDVRLTRSRFNISERSMNSGSSISRKEDPEDDGQE